MESHVNNPKKRTLADDPQYFGAFLNMARHNVFLIINHIIGHFPNQKPIKDDDQIANEPLNFIVNRNKYSASDTQKLFDLLQKFMPVVKVFNPEALPKNERSADSIDFDGFFEIINKCFKELNHFRNDYLHYYSVDNKDERKISIDEDLAGFLSTGFQRAVEYTMNRFKDTFEEKDFEIAKEKIIVTEDNVITPDGLVFFCCLFLDREYAFQFINRVVGFKGTQHKVFLATRAVFSAYCVKLPYEKLISDDPRQAFLLDMLNELNRCPDELFRCLGNEGKKQFQPNLDVLEKLEIENFDEYIQNITTKKRYRDRFPYFAMKYFDMNNCFEKLRFHINLGKYHVTEYEKSFNNSTEDRVIIENVKTFGKLEEYALPEEEKEKLIKKIEDKINLVTSKNSFFEQFSPHYHIEKNKIGLQFKSDVPEIKKYIGKKLYNKPGIPNITQIPYLIKSDSNTSRINLKLNKAHPDAFLSIHQLPKMVLIELLEKGSSEKIIKEFINNSFPKILESEIIKDVKKQLNIEKPFYKKFQGKSKNAYTSEALEILAERKERLNELLKPYKLDTKQIPTRLINYFLDIKEVSQNLSIKNVIKNHVEDIKNRLKDINKNKSPRIGEMATFLAKDIVDMMIDENQKKKFTSFYYDKLQRSIALFPSAEDGKIVFINICSKEFDLFNKEMGHPFLQDIRISDFYKTFDLYKAYLELKIQWVKRVFYSEKINKKKSRLETYISIPENQHSIPFSFWNLQKEQSSFEEWLGNIKGEKESRQKPVDLPVNLFDNKAEDLLKSKLREKNIVYGESDRFARLLELYFEKDIQPFYKNKREYNIYEEIIPFELQDNVKFKDLFYNKALEIYNKKTIERKEENDAIKIRNKSKKYNKEKTKPPLKFDDILNVFNNAITENEKLLRFYQVKDRLMLKMCENLIECDEPLNFKLEEIYPGSEISPLEIESEITQKVTGELSFDEKGNRINLDSKVKIDKTVTATRKRKDFGVFKKFIHDKRLPELFEYFDEQQIPYETLKIELADYNFAKELILDKTFELEKRVIYCFNDEFLDWYKTIMESDIHNIQFKYYLDFLKSKNIMKPDEYDFLKVVRNTFSHNQFPPKAVMERFIPINKSNGKISGQVYEKYNEKIENVLCQFV